MRIPRTAHVPRATVVGSSESSIVRPELASQSAMMVPPADMYDADDADWAANYRRSLESAGISVGK
jgi:hypothetical protein